MPDKKHRNEERDKREIRSMTDAVDELVNFGSDEPVDLPEEDIPEADAAPRREIHSMSDAVDEMRSFAAGEDDSEGEETPSKHHGTKKHAKKKRIYGEEAEEDPEDISERKHRRKASKKKKKSFFGGIFSSGKELREGEAPSAVTIMGRRLSFWPMFIGLFFVLMILALFLNSTNLAVDEQPVTLMALSPDAEGYRILVLSDLNGKRFGDGQSTLLREIDSLDYDIVICLGDMVGEDGDPEPFYELIEGLPKSKQVYFICGDSDPGPYRSTMRNKTAPLAELVLEDWVLGAIERGAIYVDSPVEIPLDNISIWLTPAEMLNINASESVLLWKDQTSQEESGYLAGIGADINSLPFTNYRYMLAENHLAACNLIDESDIHISLSHVPPTDSFIEAACNQSLIDGKYLTAPDIILAGHYCGGVWNIPLLGAFYVPDSSLERYGWFPSQDIVSGLREVDNAQIYVTRGLSSSGDTPAMPFRMLNSPEISVITITATTPKSMLE